MRARLVMSLGAGLAALLLAGCKEQPKQISGERAKQEEALRGDPVKQAELAKEQLKRYENKVPAPPQR